MQSWSVEEPLTLPASGRSIRLHDTSTGQLVSSANGPSARVYVCGITPYDATHMGHAATYVAFDLLIRAWRDAGLAVTYVQNVTDIDDPLLERAAETGESWTAIADRDIELFREDMAALRVLPPTHYVGAVESIPLVLDLVERLRERGAVYELDGDLYLAVSLAPGFGSVSRLDSEPMLALFAERGGDPDRVGKKHPLDCLVWLAERPGEPAWDSPFGRGRPGWHIECTAIALHYLGSDFDVQAGGSDLAFPHHEMCAAGAQIATGERFAKAYVHSGMVGLGGEKMSKSKGNLVFVSRLRAEGVDPMAIRLALLAQHYRSDWEWTDAALSRAQRRLDLWRSAVAAPAAPSAAPVLEVVRERLADDLDAPGAVAAIDDWAAAAAAGAGVDAEAPKLVAAVADSLLGVALH